MRGRLIQFAQGVGMLAVVLLAFWYSGIGLPPAAERLLIGARPPIVVGLVHSTTGAQAINERWIYDAELLAIEEINAAGGVLGRRLAWATRDARSDPEVAAGVARSLIEDEGAVALFGCWTSEGRKAVQEVIEERRGILFFPGNYEGMEQSGRTVYLGGSANQTVVPAVRWCYDALKARRFFVVGSEEIWSRSASEIAKDSARAAGAEVVGEAYLPPAGGGEEAAASAIKAAKPDAVLNLIVGAANKPFLAAMGRAGLAPDRMPSICFAEEELRRLPPGESAGYHAGMAYFQGLDRAEGRDLARRFKEKFGEDRTVSDPVVAAYNAVILWARAANEAGSAEADSVLSHIDRQSLDAAEGVITIDPITRVAWRPFHVGRARPDGQFDVVFSVSKPIRPTAFVGTRTAAQWRAMIERTRAGWGGRWSAPASSAGFPAATTTRTGEPARPE